ncbi:trafficking protein particle complex subunit 5 [Neocloeon triangulifer]|uniref:trafficking protein particle complex subunit 5 n=1 Tax=Neocloeon triangulifer TaxID=2078957 RepID=UPI00286F5C37|nr:trafficking protein particle complex subunit 5 [Neocloeon triangulifer]
MDSSSFTSGVSKQGVVERSLGKGKSEVSLSAFALLFSEAVQYCQSRVYTVPELQKRLHEMGVDVGSRVVDLYFVRDKSCKRETKLLNILLFIKTTVWKNLFGKEADKLEHANDDERTYYIIEKTALVNTFVSVPRDKSSLNCAIFTAGIVEAILTSCNFPAKVSAHWHQGTTYMIKFEESVTSRDQQLEER